MFMLTVKNRLHWKSNIKNYYTKFMPKLSSGYVDSYSAISISDSDYRRARVKHRPLRPRSLGLEPVSLL